MPIENTSFACSYCGTIYGSKEKVAQCEKAYEKLEEYKKTLVPWKWYRLSAINNTSSCDVFVESVKYNYSCRVNDSCLWQNICLFSYNWNSYYKVLEDWNIEEILSPMEMYKKYGIFLDEGRYSSNNHFSTTPSVSHMPRSVAKELDDVNKMALCDLVNGLISTKSKEELAKELVLAQHPMLRYTDYLDKAIEYQNKYNNGEDYLISNRIKGLDYDKNEDPLALMLKAAFDD